MKDSSNWQEQNKNNPFKVPTGYFDNFEERMMDRIAEESKPVSKRILPYSMTRWISGVAAALFLGFIGFQQFYLKPQQNLLNEEAMLNVIEYFIQDLDDISFAELIVDNEMLSLEDSGNPSADVLEWMNVDEGTIIDAMIEMAD